MGSMEFPALMTGGSSAHSIHHVYTDPAHPVGTRGAFPDGRVFYYSSFRGSTALVAGKLCQIETIFAGTIDEGIDADVGVGDTSVSVTVNSYTAYQNEFSGGYLTINNEAGEGFMYRISGNEAVSAGSSLVLKLDDPITVALTTAASKVTFQKNPFADIGVSQAGTLQLAIGVPPVAVPAGDTDPQYFWIQTWGVAPVLDSASTTAGSAVVSGPGVGNIVEWTGTAQIVGTQLVTGASGEYRPKMLTIHP